MTAALATFTPATYGAVAWDYVPLISTGGVFETNARYFATGGDSEYGAIINAQLQLIADTATQNFVLTPHLRSSFYDPKNSDLETTDLNVDGHYSWKGVLNEIDLGVAYNHVGTRNSEFSPSIPANPGDPQPPAGSGRFVSLNEYQTQISAAPSWKYQFSDQNSLTLSTNYAEVSYDKTAVTHRFHYEYTQGSLSLQHVLTARNIVFVEANGSLFRSTQDALALKNDTDAYGLRGTYQYLLSDTLSTGITVGGTISNISLISYTSPSGKPPVDLQTGLPCLDASQQPPVQATTCRAESNATDFVGQIFLKKRSARTTSNITLGRDVAPNSEGSTVTQETFNAFVIRDITEKLNGSIGLTAIHQRDVADITSRTRYYVRTDLALGWRFTEHWTARGSYAFIFDKASGTQGLITANQTVQNNFVSVEIQWQGLRGH